MTFKPYRPSNGTEGDIFMAAWCADCAFNDVDEDPCGIQLFALAHSVGDPEYPAEWVYVDDRPTCTAFKNQCFADDGEQLTPRCDRTLDMFGGPV